MGDIDPFSQIQQYTPRQADLVDVVAESRRVIDAALRSNPLRNAWVDDGLMRWKGNYGGGVNASYLWIGEFYPLDAVMGKPQRGFVLSRDDPKRALALRMYDPYADSANPVSRPLRQILTINDADNNRIMNEARVGGQNFPWGVIPLNPRSMTFSSGAVYPNLHAQNQATAGNVTQLYEGWGSMTGTCFKFIGVQASNVPTTGIGVHVVLTWQYGTTYTSSRKDLFGNSSAFFDFDIDLKALNVVGQAIQVRVYGSGIGSTSEWSWITPYRCYSYSPD